MKQSIRCLIYFILCLNVSFLGAADYYVNPKGSDQDPGTEARPFATIQKAADVMHPGDTCHIAAGRYRERVSLKRSGTAQKPIRFIAVDRHAVVVDGTEQVRGKWRLENVRIWKVDLEGPQIEQLFVNDVMQNEARWPDMPFEKRWDRAYWGAVGEQSEYGKIEAPGLSETGVDWTGGIAMLNVAHQFYTWSRDVVSHQP